MARATARVREDRWVPTVCTVCGSACSLRVHVVDGVAVKIEGDPASDWGSKGGLCAKSMSQIQVLYDPNRVNYPVRRTNPEKGIGVDPKWQRISWDEAMDEIIGRLSKIRQENPNKFMTFFGMQRPQWPAHYSVMSTVFLQAFGSKNWTCGGCGLYCGNATHPAAGMNHSAWNTCPDYEYCNYAIFFGTNQAAGASDAMAGSVRLRADAVARGMRSVSFDPVCHLSGGKAIEWVPILPGADGIVCLAMANVLVNELGIYDREYLKKKTNAPYLIKEDGRYARDDGGEPLMWDAADGRAKNWKQPVADPALEGSFEVNGVKCRPAFAALREHLKQYTPERASEISTVPAATIRRIAAEFGENARIGSTIEIQGVELPYRPVAVCMYVGASGHTNGFHTYWAQLLLSSLVGACDVPGGTVGLTQGRGLGYPETGIPRRGPVTGEDGLISSEIGPGFVEHPHTEAHLPTSPLLLELFPSCSGFSPWPFGKDSEELRQKLEVNYQIEFLFGGGCNLIMNVGNPRTVEAFLKNVFMVAIEIYQNETTEGFADIVLPETHALEAEPSFLAAEIGSYSWSVGISRANTYHLQQPAVAPQYERRSAVDICLELVDRLGIRQGWNQSWNYNYCRWVGAPDLFDPADRSTWPELVDRILKQRFGQEHGLEWFKEHGFISWPKKVEEVYWRWFVDARAQVYLEYMVPLKQSVMAICQPRGVKLDWEQYTPLISWFPTVTHKAKDEYDLYLSSFTDVLQAGGWTVNIPWVAEVSETSIYLHHILMNAGTASRKGIKDGDTVYLENDHGNRMKGTVHTIEGIHPRCLSMLKGMGRWAKGGQRLPKRQGPLMSDLIEIDLEHVDPVCLNIENGVRVKIYKAEPSA
ncbi:MAG: molybdopterin-dependent oxidoreductase [Chloroflexi bacterium]|nr:molybdopterin-dependent oxidoreductase [Chloroflexota bacterium]